jgi:membrane protease YdiL (CAAX protease family)
MPVSLRNSINSMPQSVKPVFAGVSIIAAAALFFIIGLKIELAITKTDFVHFSQIILDATNPFFTNSLRMFMVLQTLAIFAIPPFVLAYVYDKNAFDIYHLNRKPNVSYLLLAIGMIICGIPMINMMVEYNGSLLDHILGTVNSLKDQDLVTQKLIESLLQNSSIVSLFINSIIIAFIPAACEELFFRGLIQKNLLTRYMNKHTAIITAGFLFSFLHFQFYGFIPRFVLGVLFGYIFEWSGSLWVTISIHFINNFLAVLGSYFISKNIVSDSIDTVGTGSTSWIGFSSMLLVSLFVYLLYKKQYSNKLKQ